MKTVTGLLSKQVNEAMKSTRIAQMFKVADKKAQEAFRLLHKEYGVALSELTDNNIEGIGSEHSRSLKRKMTTMMKKHSYQGVVLVVHAMINRNSEIVAVEDIVLASEKGNYGMRYSKNGYKKPADMMKAYDDMLSRWDNDKNAAHTLFIIIPDRNADVDLINNKELQKELSVVYDREAAAKRKELVAEEKSLVASSLDAIAAIVGFKTNYKYNTNLNNFKVSKSGEFAEDFEIYVRDPGRIWRDDKIDKTPWTVEITKGGSGSWDPLQQPGQLAAVIAYADMAKAIANKDKNVQVLIDNATRGQALQHEFDLFTFEYNGITYRKYLSQFEVVQKDDK